MTTPVHPSTPGQSGASLPVNDLARSYQPRRVWAAGISIAWNLLIAACLLLIFQVLAPGAWLVLTAGALLILFLVTTYLAADLIPLGLFHLQPAEDATVARLTALVQPSLLPPVIVYSHPGLREFA